MGLRDIGASLPPGFRFYPSDEELVCHYLYNKIANGEVLKDTLVEIDLHTCEPWQLPEVAKLNSTEWYFFSFRERKYATGFRTNRATASGYWKATGKDRTVVHPGTKCVVGMRKTLVFYLNRAPNGIKTGWIMHEFRLENPHLPPKEDWVLCRVFHKTNSTEKSIDNLSPTYVDDTTPDATSPPSDIGDYHRMSSFFAASHHRPPVQNRNSNKQLLNSSPPLDHAYLQDHDHHVQVINHDQQFGFLLDMSFGGETKFQENIGVSLNLEEMQFDNDNGMVLF